MKRKEEQVNTVDNGIEKMLSGLTDRGIHGKVNREKEMFFISIETPFYFSAICYGEEQLAYIVKLLKDHPEVLKNFKGTCCFRNV